MSKRLSKAAREGHTCGDCGRRGVNWFPGGGSVPYCPETKFAVHLYDPACSRWKPETGAKA